MLTCLASMVLATVVSTSEPTVTEREPNDASTASSPQDSAQPLAVDPPGRRSRDRGVSERPVCAGRYLEADPTVDAGMVQRADADIDPAMVRRPECDVEQRGASDGRSVRGPGTERRGWPSVSVPRGPSAKPSDPDPAAEKPKP